MTPQLVKIQMPTTDQFSAAVDSRLAAISFSDYDEHNFWRYVAETEFHARATKRAAHSK